MHEQFSEGEGVLLLSEHSCHLGEYLEMLQLGIGGWVIEEVTEGLELERGESQVRLVQSFHQLV